MDNYTLTIKVDDGEFFEGSLDQWEESIFAFPSDFSVNEKINQIQDYCFGYGYDLTLSFRGGENEPKVKLTVT